tara:strand:- start:87 stop:629 length:543 start_codon:yes stop_codon:yes gene_type:complete
MKLRKIDFIKIDVQGAESKILKGAENSLKLAFGVELEVEFAELYSNQQLFGDVCTQLNSKGFEFIDFVNLTRWERGSHNGNGQCVFGDALFLKSPEFLNLQELCVNQIASYISILLIYRKFDLIEIALASLDEEKRLRFRLFEQALKGIKKRNVVIRMIVRILNTFISSLGSGYRLHLIQ